MGISRRNVFARHAVGRGQHRQHLRRCCLVREAEDVDDERTMLASIGSVSRARGRRVEHKCPARNQSARRECSSEANALHVRRGLCLRRHRCRGRAMPRGPSRRRRGGNDWSTHGHQSSSPERVGCGSCRVGGCASHDEQRGPFELFKIDRSGRWWLYRDPSSQVEANTSEISGRFIERICGVGEERSRMCANIRWW